MNKEVEMEWWRFWADCFILTSASNHEHWYETISHLIAPCNRFWGLVYLSRWPVANDNAATKSR